MAQWCGVIYRRFHFSLYPPHVHELKTYAFKPLIVQVRRSLFGIPLSPYYYSLLYILHNMYILALWDLILIIFCMCLSFVIQDILRHFGGLFWIDSSVRFFSSNLTRAWEQMLQNGGIAVMKEVAHSNNVAVHPDMYGYLPSNQEMQKRTPQSAATAFILYRTKDLYWGILHWWFLCALDPRCLSPVSKTPCDHKKAVFRKGNMSYSGCHRFDQAALNILVSNYYGYDSSRYAIGRKTGFLVIEKHVTHHERIHVC